MDSAIPALEDGPGRSAQYPRKNVCSRLESGRIRVVEGRANRRMRQARVKLAEGQMIQKPPLYVGANHRFAVPVRSGPIAQLCVNGRARAMVLVVGVLVVIAQLDDRHEPVPVQHGHVVIAVRRGMPAEKVVVIAADLAWGVVVADVVIIGLGQWHVHKSENQ